MALKIVPITKQRYERDVRGLLRSPYNSLPFAIFKRTQGKGMLLLYDGTRLLKAGSKRELIQYARQHG